MQIQRQSAERSPSSFAPTRSRLLQRKCACGGTLGLDGECAECRGNSLQRDSSARAEPVSEVPSIVHEVLRSPGQPLDSTTREFMEARFGHDFSKVRVHADARAAESARAVNAQAYTVGGNVVFGAGRFVPGTHAGKSLLAHELTHVVQQGAGSPVLQRKPDEEAQSMGALELPWKFGDYSLFEDNRAGIRFLVGISSEAESTVRAVIPSIGKRIAADNSRIKDPSSRVTICFIVPTTTRFALWEGKPVLMLDPPDATVETAAHEMGHAIFHALETQAESKTKDAAKAANFRLKVADIYARLSQTKEFTEGNETHPAGLWIADPSQWGPPGSAKEHPWQDPDEFFASAKEAYQVNRKGFVGAIARFKKLDPAVAGPATELLALLDAFFREGELPSRGVPAVRAAAAKSALQRATRVSKVEDTVMSGTLLDLLLNPGNRRRREKPRPSLPDYRPEFPP